MVKRTTRNSKEELSASKSPLPGKVKSKVVKPKNVVTRKKSISKKKDEDETLYEEIVRKVNEKRAAENRPLIGEEDISPAKRKKTNATQADQVTARTLEDDNFIDMDISGIRHEFPSEEDEDEVSDDEEGSILSEPTSSNNNAMVQKKVLNYERGAGASSSLSGR